MKYLFTAVILLSTISLCSFTYKPTKTSVSIQGEQFYINNQITYKNRFWQGNKIEGLLFNSRMVQGIFDDLNANTRDNFKYPDSDKWDAARNTEEFVAAMSDWKDHGLLSFTLNLQGGSPLGYGNHGWINSTFDSLGNLREDYLNRLEKILNKSNELGMIVILGYFYFGQDEQLKDEQAVVNAVDNITNWILRKGYKNILIEINNECDVKYDHTILQPKRVHELIKRVQEISGNKLLVSTSYGGNKIPSSEVIAASDFVLLHGNGVNDPKRIEEMVAMVRQSESYSAKPILFNEDDHFDFDKESYNFLSATKSYASWGYFDFRMKGEGYNSGFQSVPVDWKISSDRKKAFFNKLKEITGY
ncbi:hypothetical protein [Arenibacter sp. F20364]|uniref:hypothetical protein n=1 Tax=Arenibacter sp. F20364 TaxID=2926415 RepID=UPI001FF6EEBE|nr:hypothetical protein [Arenibacter sp. F20364]MCK0192420.1 hypothetical protein [Arenibacter sp. F20364]